jgi:uncharacterized protein YcnI
MKFLLVALLVVGSAFAHVVVKPAESRQGQEQQYTLRMPNEKTVATVKLVLTVPATLKLVSTQSPTGWKVRVDKDLAGRKRATLTGSLAPKEVMEFTFVGRNPKSDTLLEWHAVQTYADGTVVDWAGPEGSKSPASRTKLLP